MGCQLTVLLPAIRVERWERFYDSINKSFSGTWELIIITEKEQPESLRNKSNVRFVYSERAPLHKQQEGLCLAEGEWILYGSDDQIFIEGALDKAFLKAKDYKTIVVMKYLEGDKFDYPDWFQKVYPYKTNYEFMESDQYYLCGTHKSSQYKYIPQDSPILSCALISRQELWEIGGWDCAFYTQAIGNVDLSVRLIKDGCKYIIHDEIVETCGHMPGVTGDHSALHFAQIDQDEPLLKKMYEDNYDENRVVIPIENWKRTEPKWQRREK